MAGNRGRETRGFGAVGPGERKKGTVTRASAPSRSAPAPARKPASPPTRTLKARVTGAGARGATFPTISISSKRVKVSNLPVGAPVPNTIVFGRTTFTKKGT